MPTSSKYEKPSWLLVAGVSCLFLYYGILPEISDRFARDSSDAFSLLVYMTIIYRLVTGRKPAKRSR